MYEERRGREVANVKVTHGNPLSDRDVPEADVLEQAAPAGAQDAETSTPSPEIADRPEADVLEQTYLVEEQEVVDRSASHDAVSEADWLEQTIAEPIEEERR